MNNNERCLITFPGNYFTQLRSPATTKTYKTWRLPLIYNLPVNHRIFPSRRCVLLDLYILLPYFPVHIFHLFCRPALQHEPFSIIIRRRLQNSGDGQASLLAVAQLRIMVSSPHHEISPAYPTWFRRAIQSQKDMSGWRDNNLFWRDGFETTKFVAIFSTQQMPQLGFADVHWCKLLTLNKATNSLHTQRDRLCSSVKIVSEPSILTIARHKHVGRGRPACLRFSCHSERSQVAA